MNSNITVTKSPYQIQEIPTKDCHPGKIDTNLSNVLDHTEQSVRLDNSLKYFNNNSLHRKNAPVTTNQGSTTAGIITPFCSTIQTQESQFLNKPEIELHNGSNKIEILDQKSDTTTLSEHQSVISSNCSEQTNQTSVVTTYPLDQKSMPEGKIFLCKICNILFADEATFKAHMNNHDMQEQQSSLKANNDCNSPKVFSSYAQLKNATKLIKKKEQEVTINKTTLPIQSAVASKLPIKGQKKQNTIFVKFPTSQVKLLKLEVDQSVIQNKSLTTNMQEQQHYSTKVSQSNRNNFIAVDNTIKCFKCPNEFQHLNPLRLHMYKHWMGDKICGICNIPVIGSTEDFNLHLMEHLGESQNPNHDLSSQQTKISSQLSKISATTPVHPKAEIQFICKQCKMPFSNEPDLKKHGLIHIPKSELHKLQAVAKGNVPHNVKKLSMQFTELPTEPKPETNSTILQGRELKIKILPKCTLNNKQLTEISSRSELPVSSKIEVPVGSKIELSVGANVELPMSSTNTEKINSWSTICKKCQLTLFSLRSYQYHLMQHWWIDNACAHCGLTVTSKFKQHVSRHKS